MHLITHSLLLAAAALAGGIIGARLTSPVTAPVDPPLSAQPGVATADDLTAQRLTQLEQHLALLQTRIDALETQLPPEPEQEAEETLPGNGEAVSNVIDAPITADSRVLDPAHLVQAGIDTITAEELVRRKNAHELQKLELRDRAAREGYLGSKRHMQELQAIIDEDFSLREAIGDDAYDRYLYASGQANRVRVAAVITGSAAEQAGIQPGDLILRYGEQRLFDWRELQQATTEGNRNEYVSISVIRNGEETVLWIPRGPLGVRLSMMRVNPDR